MRLYNEFAIQQPRSFPDPAVSISVLVVVSPPFFLPTLLFAQYDNLGHIGILQAMFCDGVVLPPVPTLCAVPPPQI